MSAPRDYQTEAIIIKKTKLGEADRILTLYTPELGKVEAVAKGIRRPKARLAGHLELLTHSHITLVRGKNLDTIIGSQTINSFITLKSNLWPAACALYAVELVNQFTVDHIDNQPLFKLLLATLQRLSQPGNMEAVLRYFEMHLLNETGYRPELYECVSCRKMLQPVDNSFSYSSGGTVCPSCSQAANRSISINAIKVLRLLQMDDFDTIMHLRIDVNLYYELESLLRAYFKFLLERDIKSTSWLDSLRSQHMTTTQNALL